MLRVIAVLLMFAVSPVLAQVPSIISDRPDFTESFQVVPLKAIQFEGGYTFSRIADRKNNEFGELLIRANLRENIELRIGISSLLMSSYQIGTTTGMHNFDFSGMSDASVGIKYTFVRETETQPGFGIILESTLPFGSDDFSSEMYEATALLALSKGMTDRFSFSSNIAYSRTGRIGYQYNQFHASLTGIFLLDDEYGCYLEVFQIFRPYDMDNPSYVNSGLTKLISDNFQFDARVGARFTKEHPDYFLGFGFSYRYFRK